MSFLRSIIASRHRTPPASGFTLLVDTVAGGDSSGVTTGSIDTTGCDFLVAAVGEYAGSSGTSMTDSKGNTWNIITSNNGTTRTHICYCVPTSVGSGHTFSWAGSSVFASIVVAGFSGAHASPFDQSNGSTGSSATLATGSVTPSEDDELLITSSTSVDSAGVPTINSGFTVVDGLPYSPSNYFSVAMGMKIQTAAGAENPTWTWTNSSEVAAKIVTFKKA